MKKFIIPILFIALFAMSTQAQDKKFEFSLKGGYSYDQPKTTNDTIFSSGGIHIGPLVTYNINESFGIQAGILYNYYKSIDVITDLKNATGNWTQNKLTAQYIDVPIKLQYSINLADDIYVRLLAGPSINYGLTQKTNHEEYANNEFVKSKFKTWQDFYNNSRYSPFDLKFGVGASIQYLKYSLNASYDWGLLDRDNTTLTYKANNIKIGIAYTF